MKGLPMRRRDLVLLVPSLISAQEADAIVQLADIILPGAGRARVNFHIETTLRHAPQGLREQWARGVAALDAESRRRCGKIFALASREEQTGIVAFMARGEADPQSEIERFFVLAKRMTVDGYVLSEEGQRDWLGVDGGAHGEFTGCNHPEHLSRR
jgi:hypothetical protein